MGQLPCLPPQAEREVKALLDPKDLNAAIQREHHVTPTLEEMLPKLADAKVFSIVDTKCGYWNVVLDEESSYLVQNPHLEDKDSSACPLGSKCLKMSPRQR